MNWFLRTALALGVLAVAVGLPLATEVVVTGEKLHGMAAQAGGAPVLVISEPIALLPALPLFIDRGSLRSADSAPVKPGETMQRLDIDGAVFRVPIAGISQSGQTQVDARETTPNVTLNPGSLLAQLAALNANSIRLRRSRIDFVAADGTTYTLGDVTADITSSRRTTFTGIGTATFNGQLVRIEATWSTPETKGDGIGRVPLKLIIRAALVDAVLDGRLATSGGLKFTGEADVRVSRLRALSRWFGLDVPMSTDLRDASIVGPISWADGLLTFSRANISVDGNKGLGVLVLRTRANMPSIEGTLDFRSLDLQSYMAGQLAPTITKSARDERQTIAAAFNADLRLSAAKIKMPPFETGRGAVTLSLKNGRLLAHVADLEIEGGNASGEIKLDVNGDVPRLTVKGRLTQVDPGRMFADGLKRNPLLARAQLAIDGDGTGYALSEMLDNFSGKGTMSLPAGGRLGLDLKALAYAATKSRSVGWSAAGKGVTPLETLDLRFLISNGALTVEGLKAKFGQTTFVGEGKVDLRGRLLDLTLAHGEIGAAPGSPVVVRETLAIRGAWADPAISLIGRPFTGTAPAVKGATVAPPAMRTTAPVERE